ncbi:MAG TPA: M14 family zinc carboxypeptidase [Actinomycetota bacterium]|nr:M14 family zinc carboxypeptidase [Actinomycetota bacterium]
MRKLIVTALVLTLVTALAPIGRTDTAKLALVRVPVASEEQAAYLMTRFDETHNHSHDEIELLLWPGDRAALDSLGWDYRVVTEDVVARDRALAAAAAPGVPQRLPGPNYDDYRHLSDYNTEMQDLAKKNPRLIKLFEMKRPTLEGRTVYGLEISADVKRQDGRPIFYMDAVHHAREWPAAEFTMIYAHYLAERFGKDPKVTSLLNRARVILVPLVNPDGFNYSRESVTSINQPVRNATQQMAGLNGFEGYWRKNRRSLTGATVPGAQVNPDAYGVDPNRNYAYLWGDQQGGSSNQFFSQTYRGEAPFSEPEVANVADIIRSRNVTGIITNHTVQATVLRTGGGRAPEDDILVTIGARLADMLGFQNNASVGYPTTGTTDDWAYAAMGAFGFTIEHGGSGFHCAYADCVGTPTDRTMKAFTIMLETSANARYHSVLTGKVAGGAAKLTLAKTFQTPLSDGNPLGKKAITEKLKWSIPTKANGSFEWHVTPSTRPYVGGTESYTLTITQGGKTKRMSIVVDRAERLDLGTIKL